MTKSSLLSNKHASPGLYRTLQSAKINFEKLLG